MQRILLNIQAKPREETLHGRKYLVVPGTLLAPGVLPGSQGPLFYPAEEMAKSVQAWNGMPIIGRHAFEGTEAVSARNPSVLAQQGLGFVFNGFFDGKLKAEHWFDEELTAAFDNTLEESVRILPKLRAGQPISSSTGLFTTNEVLPAEASFNGTSYKMVARDYRPDHVAILPDQTPACSIDQGCGVLVNQDEPKKDSALVDILKRVGRAIGVLHPVPTVNELSFEDIRMLLSRALRSQFLQSDPSCYICEVYDSYFVYEQGEETYQLDYTRTEAGVELGDTPVKVVRQMTYTPVMNNSLHTEEPMPLTPQQRQAIVQGLVTNCACWKQPKDQAVLNSLTDDQLQQLEAASKTTLVPTPAPATIPVAPPVQPVQQLPLSDQAVEQLAQAIMGKLKLNPAAPTTTPPAPAPIPVAPALTTNEWLAAVPADIRTAVLNSYGMVQKQKETLVDQLVANVNDQAQREAHKSRLMGKDVSELEYLVALLPPASPTIPVFMGGGGGRPVVNAADAADDEPLVPPVLDYQQMAQERNKLAG